MPSDDAAALVDGRRRRWQEHNQVRRQVIIDAAMAVLGRQEPGEDVQVQAVADEANMSRTVIYRHFTDRADLDRAVQRQICGDLGVALHPALTYQGTADAVIHGLVSALVRWAHDHPNLYFFVERDLAGWGPSPLSKAIEQVAQDIEKVMAIVLAALDADLDEDERAALDPWVFGMIGAAFAAIRRWLERPVRAPGLESFTEILSESITAQINGMSRARGLNLPDLPLSDLMRVWSRPEGDGGGEGEMDT